MSYKAILFAPDGDYVTDYRGCATVEQVWDYVNNQGSRWFFYPICFVVKDEGTTKPNQRVLSACDNFEFLEGRSVKTIRSWIRENPNFLQA